MSGGMVGTAAILLMKVALVSFLAGGGAYWILSAWMNRALSATEAVMLMIGLILVTFFLVSYALSQGFGAVFAMLLLIAAAVVGMSHYSRVADRKLSQRFDDEDIATYREALELDPTNAAAHSLLADLYRRREQYELALQEYEEAVRIAPTLQEERYWVGRLKDKLSGIERGGKIPGEEMDTPCPVCRAIVPAYAERCQECGEYLGKA